MAVRSESDDKRADVGRFIDLLMEATSASPLTVVLTVRADFYDHLLQHHTLPSAIQGRQVNLGPMTRAQLECCIEGPVKALEIGFEDERLVKRILDDVGEDEGKLPLLEYAGRSWMIPCIVDESSIGVGPRAPAQTEDSGGSPVIVALQRGFAESNVCIAAL